MMTGELMCTVCGDGLAVIVHRNSDMCQFCWDYLSRLLNKRSEAIRMFGQYHRENRGPRHLAIFWTGEHTLGYGLYVPETPEAAMKEARQTATRNNWKLLRVDIQETLADIFVSDEYGEYFPYSDKKDATP